MTDPRIISVGSSPFGQTSLPGRDLFSIAISEAFESLPEPAKIVDALYVGNQSERYERQIMYGTLLAEWAGLRYIPAQRVEGCAAAGSLALQNAIRDVKAGIHEVVLACGLEKMTARGTQGATNSLATAFDRAIDQRVGVTAPSQYALLAQRYLYETDTTESDLARIAVKNHRRATDNPRAHFQREIDVETVLDSDYIAPPLKLYDCAPVSDGAAVAIVATPDVADELVSEAEQISVIGSGVAVNNLAVVERNLTVIEGAAASVDMAYTEAGVENWEIDVAEVHDAFTVCEALLAEAAGFCPKGYGAESALSQAERSSKWTGVEVNTSGGLKARGHPIGATGIAQVIELYEQLTDQAGARQVPNATIGLSINEGGVADAVTAAHVLRSVI